MDGAASPATPVGLWGLGMARVYGVATLPVLLRVFRVPTSPKHEENLLSGGIGNGGCELLVSDISLCSRFLFAEPEELLLRTVGPVGAAPGTTSLTPATVVVETATCSTGVVAAAPSTPVVRSGNWLMGLRHHHAICHMGD